MARKKTKKPTRQFGLTKKQYEIFAEMVAQSRADSEE